MEEQEEYGFCPKCGAVMHNGICQSCGYARRSARETVKKPGRERRGGSLGKALACVGVIAGVLLILMLLVLAGAFVFGSFFSGSVSVRQDSFAGDVYDGYEPYVPDENDEFYLEITDATSLDCSYRVIWESRSLYPDDPDDGCTYDCVYPVVEGDGGYSSVNARIRDMACEYEDTYRDCEGGVTSYGYVTYMDEERLSVVVRHELYEGGTVLPKLEAVSFRMDTGEEIPREEMAAVDEELVRQFRTRDSYQNGGVDYVEGASDEELLRLLSSDSTAVMFYTPVGLEIGFNYEDGWVTVTLKDTIL